ncbi:MAG: hypothetical protein ACLFV8_07620 [Alphaproteobacteria bacterium]
MTRLTATAILAAAIVPAGGLTLFHGAIAASGSGPDRNEHERRTRPAPSLRHAHCARHFVGNVGRFNRYDPRMHRQSQRDATEPYVCSFVTRIVCKTGMIADRPAMTVNHDGTITIRYGCRKP